MKNLTGRVIDNAGSLEIGNQNLENKVFELITLENKLERNFNYDVDLLVNGQKTRTHVSFHDGSFMFLGTGFINQENDEVNNEIPFEDYFRNFINENTPELTIQMLGIRKATATA